jgi:hypothetical protein
MFCTTHLDLAVVESEELGYVSSNDDGSFPFYVDFVIPLSPTRLLSDLTIHMSNTTGVISESEMLTLRENLDSPPVCGGVRVAHLVCFLCCVGYLCFVCLPPVSCVSNVISVSALSILDCLFGCL